MRTLCKRSFRKVAVSSRCILVAVLHSNTVPRVPGYPVTRAGPARSPVRNSKFLLLVVVLLLDQIQPAFNTGSTRVLAAPSWSSPGSAVTASISRLTQMVSKESRHRVPGYPAGTRVAGALYRFTPEN
eukprot:3009498-Rhodomonas_salina.3